MSLGYTVTYILSFDFKPEWYEKGLSMFWIICSLIGMMVSGVIFVENINKAA
jgi:hypothetical protein